MKLSKRVSGITPSKTLAITNKANELKASGVKVIGLGAGEPDLNTPTEVIDYAFKAVKDGKTKYTASGGIIELKNKIIEKYKKDFNLNYEPNEVYVGSGAKHVLYNIFQALLNEGDEVIVPSPYWVSYPEQIKLAGGKPVFVETSESSSFKVTPEILDDYITHNTKAIIINSPSNPTGMVYSKDELQALSKYLVEKEIYIISDEIYDALIYNDMHVSIASNENAKDFTIIVNGVSKSHAMTGWRIGYALADSKLIKAITNLASHSTSNPATPSQWAAIGAYNLEDEFLHKFNLTFKKRRDSAFEQLSQIKGVECIKPEGAFYLFPNFKEYAKLTGHNSVDDLCDTLLEELHVAVVPGSSFGNPNNIRMSYALSEEDMNTALKRIKDYINGKTLNN